MMILWLAHPAQKKFQIHPRDSGAGGRSREELSNPTLQTSSQVEFWKCLDISVLRASSLLISWSAVTGCPTSNSAEMAKAVSSVWSSEPKPACPLLISSYTTSPQSSASNFSWFSVCIQALMCCRKQFHMDIYYRLFQKSPVNSLFHSAEVTLILLHTHTTLFCLSLNLLCLASGQNPFFCLEGGWQHAFEETPRLLLGWPAGRNPAQHSLASPTLLFSFPRNMLSRRRQRLSWSRFPKEIFKQQMKFKHMQRMLELEETSQDHPDHPLALRQIQLYLQDTADRYLSHWLFPASSHRQ